MGMTNIVAIPMSNNGHLLFIGFLPSKYHKLAKVVNKISPGEVQSDERCSMKT